MGVADILNNLEPRAGEDADRRIWLALPAGYIPLPVQDGPAKLVEVEPVLRELCPPEKQSLLTATMVTLATLLAELQVRNALYCGLGWHTAPTDAALVSSTLVVSVQNYGAERNPRLVLGDLVTAAANDGEHAQADLVDLPNGPALFVESIRSLPRPALPGQQGDPGTADVFQLEAVVPSEKGDWLAALEFSTPQVEYGPLFREMMILLANSVSFVRPPEAEPENASTQRIHSLLEGGTTR
jgi:hypothetical protein